MREGILLMDFVLPPPRSCVGDVGGGAMQEKGWAEAKRGGGMEGTTG